MYPRVIEGCRLPFEPRHDFLLASHHRRRNFSQRDVSLGEETSGNRWVYHKQKQFVCEFPLIVHLLR